MGRPEPGRHCHRVAVRGRAAGCQAPRDRRVHPDRRAHPDHLRVVVEAGLRTGRRERQDHREAAGAAVHRTGRRAHPEAAEAAHTSHPAPRSGWTSPPVPLPATARRTGRRQAGRPRSEPRHPSRPRPRRDAGEPCRRCPTTGWRACRPTARAARAARAASAQRARPAPRAGRSSCRCSRCCRRSRRPHFGWRLLVTTLLAEVEANLKNAGGERFLQLRFRNRRPVRDTMNA